MPFLEELVRELAGGGRLAGALEADHHDAGRAPPLAVAERGVDRAHEGLELVVADLDEVVLRRDPHDALLRLHLGVDDLADRLLADAGDEALHHLERDVGLEEGDADVAERVVDHLGGDLRAPLQLVARCLEPFGYGLEHRTPGASGQARAYNTAHGCRFPSMDEGPRFFTVRGGERARRRARARVRPPRPGPGGARRRSSSRSAAPTSRWRSCRGRSPPAGREADAEQLGRLAARDHRRRSSG